MRIRNSTHKFEDHEPIEPPAPLFASLSRPAEIDRLFAGEARATSHEAILRRQLEQAQSQLLRYARDLCRLSHREETVEAKRSDQRSIRPRGAADPDKRGCAGAHEIGPPEVVSASLAFQRTLQMCRKVAMTDATVLLHGETGTGKEVCASVIHHSSPRREQRLVAINCAALPESLLESELFGHEAGAFTGANHQKVGLFEAADGGTLFLDEIGEMALNVQTKFLRVLEERRFTRVGSTKSIKVNVRVVAATNRDLAEEVKAGRFRSDLYYRLNVVPIDIPSLRERVADIPALVEHFIKFTAGRLGMQPPTLDLGVMDSLVAHDWPGNVREVRNLVERLVVLSEGGVIRLSDLPENLRRSVDLDTPDEIEASTASRLDEHERSLILHTLIEVQWNQSAAARRLGIPRSTLRHLLRKHSLQQEERNSA